MREEAAILAGGCYWGTQELLRRHSGVASTRVGWSGGDTPNPTDDNHGDHAESVQIIFDADTTSYRDLLEFFFQIHDPTTLNRQGGETGRSVRSAIFYTSEEQRVTALDTIADVDVSGLWPGTVVTEVVAAGSFWEAGEEDQDYLQKHPAGETCHFVRPGWKLPHRQPQTTSTDP
ncbi:MAG: peptide-methionine (S)-S-oxide reductase MsrA [Acidimicrobiales bacterium]|jgi:peptide-methionine (S)-S-oxide reductase